MPQTLSHSSFDDSSLNAAREAMVVSQLQPSGIISERILNAYRAVKREDFLPRDKASIAYTDETIFLPNGSFLCEPLIHGLMLEHTNPAAGERVLIVGDETGYTKALLNFLTCSVFECAAKEGHADNAPYDVILVLGALSAPPQELNAQLNVGGRLAYIECPIENALGKILLTTKNTQGVCSTRVLKDAKLPYLKGSAPSTQFIF